MQRKMNTRGLGVMRRICKRCGGEFTLSRDGHANIAMSASPRHTNDRGCEAHGWFTGFTSCARIFEKASLMTWRGSVNVNRVECDGVGVAQPGPKAAQHVPLSRACTPSCAGPKFLDLIGE
jgi:hypothetical protein